MPSDDPSSLPTGQQPTSNTLMSSSESAAANGSIANPPAGGPELSKSVRLVDAAADAFGGTADQPHKGVEAAVEGEEVLSAAPNPVPLSEVCADVYRRVQNFLAVEGRDEVMTRTQVQVRESMDVMAQALVEYG